MEEIEELRARAMASMPSSTRRNRMVDEPDQAKEKEEGELSSSSDRDMPVCASGQAASSTHPQSEVQDPVNQNIERAETSSLGKCGPIDVAPYSDVQLRCPSTHKYNSHFAPGWQVPPDGGGNLVISFSDGSGSDSDENQDIKTVPDLESKKIPFGLDGHKRPEIQFQSNSKTLPQVGNNQLRITSKKTVASRTFTSVMSNICRPHSGPSGAFSYGRGTRVSKLKSQSKYLPGQKHQYNQVVNSTDKELESLRQQIAMRENELKRKAVPQGKETPSGSDGEHYSLKVHNIEEAKVTQPINSGIVLNELEKKRQKSGENSRSKIHMDGYDNSEPKKQVIQDQQQKRDDKQSMNSLNDSQSFNKCIQFDTVLNRSTKLNLASKAEGEVLQEISLPRKQCSPGSRQISTLDRTRKPDASCQHGLSRFSEQNEVMSGDTTHQHASPSALNVPLHDGNLTNLGGSHLSSQNNVLDMQSLLKIEELQDKELEEAQELRRRCELEERSALKAYRLAQRALINVNERCTYLYRERELFSARLRAYTMENSCSLWPPMWQKSGEAGHSSRSISVFNVNQLPSLSCQMEAGYGASDLMRRNADIQFAGHGSPGAFFKCSSELDSIPCACTSEPSSLHGANAVHTTANSPTVILDEVAGTSLSNKRISQSGSISNILDEACKEGGGYPKEEVGNITSIENVQDSTLLESTLRSQLFARLGEGTLSKEDNLKGRMTDPNQDTRMSSIQNVQDSALLEASLRTELFARLGLRNLADNSGLDVSHRQLDNRAGQDNVEINKTEMVRLDLPTLSNQDLLEADQNQRADEKGHGVSNGIYVHSHCNALSPDDRSSESSDPGESCAVQKESYNSLFSSIASPPSSAVKVVYKHLRNSDELDSFCNGISSKETKNSMDVYNDIKAPNFVGKRAENLNSLTDIRVDPFWPHCLFELRGKCNSDQCPWQHTRDYSRRESQQPCLFNASAREKFDDAFGNLRCVHGYIMPVPTYRIGSCLIKAESVSSRYIRNIWQYGRIGFCNSLGTPFSVNRSFPPVALYMNSGDCEVEEHENWSKSSLFYQTLEDRVKQLMRQSSDCEHSLEVALEFFINNVNRKEGRKKALALLSRSIEADPTSVVLWVSYLQIFFEKEKTIGEDDMFLHAIQHNGGSYELWVMYINSRTEFHSCLDGYNTAIKSFICMARSSNKESRQTSACLLDLSLHMFDFLCMSGNVDNAMSIIDGLLPSAVELDNSSQITISDVIACLITCDKCTLLVCCVYLMIFKKLPKAVVQRFEFEQELPFDIEWPSIQLTVEEKGRAIEMMNIAANTEMLGGGDGEWVVEDATRSKHFLALSHVKCVMAVENLERGRTLLVQYMKLYPCCIELSLMWARLQEVGLTNDNGLKGFDDVLLNWLKEVPGVHCVWNQYIELALENGMLSLAKELINRWFHSVGKVQNDRGQEDDSDASSEASYAMEPNAYVSQRDKLFRLLNLSLYQFLQSNQAEAQVTMDEALSFTTAEDFGHCAREHAASRISRFLDPVKDSLAFLLRYLMDHRASLSVEPLSRRFCKSVKKPRIRQLINKVLGPPSAKAALMNSILEVLYGPTLLPEKFNELKDMVDFVEGLLHILPANYELALSVCKLIQKFNLAGNFSTSMMCWASSVLVNSVLQAFPVAPEHIWVEATDVLGKLGIEVILDRFYQIAVSVYPFSMKLWQSYVDFCKAGRNVGPILEAARERGIVSKLVADV